MELVWIILFNAMTGWPLFVQSGHFSWTQVQISCWWNGRGATRSYKALSTRHARYVKVVSWFWELRSYVLPFFLARSKLRLFYTADEVPCILFALQKLQLCGLVRSLHCSSMIFITKFFLRVLVSFCWLVPGVHRCMRWSYTWAHVRNQPKGKLASMKNVWLNRAPITLPASSVSCRLVRKCLGSMVSRINTFFYHDGFPHAEWHNNLSGQSHRLSGGMQSS